MFRNFLFAMLLYAPVMSMAQEVTEPFCDVYVARLTTEVLQIEGYLTRQTIIQKIRNEINYEAKVIGFKKLGRTPLAEGATVVDPDDFLYQIIVHLKIQGEDNQTYELVAIDEISTYECSMTGKPLVILTSPEYRVIGNWESYLQFKEAVRQAPKGQTLYKITPTPNLIK